MSIIRELLTKWGFDADTNAVEQFDRGIGNAKKNVQLATIAIGSATAAIGVLLKRAGEMEQVEIAFETMTGSAEAARDLLKDITDFAAKTPFELTGLIESSKQLLAFGVESDKIVGTMGNLGNIAAGVGRDKLPTLVRAFGKIRTKGKATMEELNMLLEAGVPILDELAKNHGVTTEALFKMISAGKIGFADVDKALAGLATGTGKFANLMEKQSKSFLGIVSNIIDFVGILANSIGKELLPEAKAIGKEILVFLDANRALIKTKAVNFFKGLAKFVIVAFKGIKDLAQSVDGIVQLFGGWEFVLKALGTALLVLFGARTLISIGQMVSGVSKLVTVTSLLSRALGVANLKAAVLPLLIGVAVVALGLIIEDIISFFQGKDSLTGKISEWLKETAKASGVLGTVAAAVDLLGGFIGGLTAMLVGLFTLDWNLFIEPLKSAWEIIKKISSVAGGFLGKLFAGGLEPSIAERAGQSLGAVGAMTPVTAPAPAAGGKGGGARTTNMSVNAPITVNVPPGTPPEQVGQSVSKGVDDALSRMLRETSQATEPVEAF